MQKPVFSEQEIAEAFIKCDVDGNNFIGISDLTAVLRAVTGGQEVDDRVVDEMIGMVDSDGDAQCDFHEFRRMVMVDLMGLSEEQFKKRPAFADARIAAAAAGLGTPARAAASTPASAKEAPSTPAQRRSVEQRVAMRTSLVKFAELFHLSSYRLEEVFWRVIHTQEEGQLARVDYPSFCSIFETPDNALARDVFGVFEESDRLASVRLIVLAIGSVLDLDSVRKTEFAFGMCDASEQGYIDRQALVDILRANHLTVDVSEVQRKSSLIMTAARSKERVAFKDFVAVSKRFPNVIFPIIGSTPQPLARTALPPVATEAYV